jgi:hypothetical protein
VKRVMVSLVIAAGAVYAVNTWFQSNTSGLPGDGDKSVGAANSSDANPLRGGDDRQTDYITPPVDASSPHAIVPGGSPLPPSDNAHPRSTIVPEELLLDGTDPPPPTIDDTQAESVKVTARASIQQGPSPSAPVIGIAHPGAEAQVISRDSEWVQIIDPSSKKTGWVHSRFLEPQTEAGSTSGQVEAALEPADEAARMPPPRPEAALTKPGKHGWKRKRHRRGFALRYRLRRFF